MNCPQLSGFPPTTSTSPEWLPTCPLTIHALLHISDQIRWMGSCWTTWAFPIERQCGYFQRNIQSPRNPYLGKPPKHLSSVVPLF
ncbi:hypothetical protein BGY98DRAFT_1071901 [Russula aff. rugulosa BPL654]|nr:hypothetical protein BGY98DRAFT_1071901 [Russula aff. rugulosa BPL654]